MYTLFCCKFTSGSHSVPFCVNVLGQMEGNWGNGGPGPLFTIFGDKIFYLELLYLYVISWTLCFKPNFFLTAALINAGCQAKWAVYNKVQVADILNKDLMTYGNFLLYLRATLGITGLNIIVRQKC